MTKERASDVDIEAMARRFSELLLDEIGETRLSAVNERNGTDAFYRTSDTCASHDFCDANMVMEAAFRHIMGRDPWMPCDREEGKCTEDDEQADVHAWNAAWEKAKARQFRAEA